LDRMLGSPGAIVRAPIGLVGRMGLGQHLPGLLQAAGLHQDLAIGGLDLAILGVLDRGGLQHGDGLRILPLGAQHLAIAERDVAVAGLALVLLAERPRIRGKARRVLGEGTAGAPRHVGRGGSHAAGRQGGEAGDEAEPGDPAGGSARGRRRRHGGRLLGGKMARFGTGVFR
jgi:hypothetical protein